MIYRLQTLTGVASPARQSGGVAAILALSVLWASVFPSRAQARPPWETIPSFADLDRSERSRVERLARAKAGYGPCAKATIEACFERGSRMGWRLARLLIFLVQRGAEDDDIDRFLAERKASYEAPSRDIDPQGSPAVGPETAPVTVVEFADFECPMCAAVTPSLKEVVTSLGGKARLVFKQFPIKGHRNSFQAALASVAAHRHGKFWEMAALLFQDLDRHELHHLEEYARKLGIPPETLKTGLRDPATLRRVEQDKDLGLRLGVRATPTLFINGREFRPLRESFYLRDRIEEELDRIEGKK